MLRKGGKRSSGNYIIDKRVYVDAIGQPRGILFEFKARSEVAAGFESILPWIGLITYITNNREFLTTRVKGL